MKRSKAASLVFLIADLDYAVRNHINRCLRRLAGDTTACEKCSKNAAYQLAVFKTLSFGTSADEYECAQLLARSGKDQMDLEVTLQEIRELGTGEHVHNRKIIEDIFTGLLPIRERTSRPPRVLQVLRETLELEVSAVSKNLGLTHSVTHVLHHTLHAFYLHNHEYDRAIELCRGIIAGFDEKLSSAQQNVEYFRVGHMSVMCKLAETYRAAWRLPEAIETANAALEETRSMHGGSELLALKHMHDVADIYFNAVLVDEAIEIVDEVIERMVDMLGVYHPLVVCTLGRFGHALQDRHLYEDADEILAKALEIAGVALGDPHRYTLTIKNVLANNHLKLDQPIESLKLLLELQAIYISVLEEVGSCPPEYLDVLIALAYTFSTLEEHDQAKSFALEAERRSQDLLGRGSHMHLCALSTLVEVRRVNGDLEDLDQLAAELVDMGDSLFGTDHPRAYALQKLSTEVLCHLHRYDDAEKILRKIMQGYMTLELPSLRALYSLNWDLANCLRYKGEWTEAVVYFSEALRLSRKLHGDHHDEVLSDMGDLAEAYTKLRRWDDAISLRLEILGIVQQQHGAESVESAGAMCEAAQASLNVKRLCDAEQLYKAAGEILIKTEGKESENTLTCLYNIAHAMTLLGRATNDLSKIQDAVRVGEELFESSLKVRGAMHEGTREVLMNLLVNLTLLGRDDDASALKIRFQELVAKDGPGDTQ
jgi:tetratricopeptide (TPR) repeat protein